MEVLWKHHTNVLTPCEARNDYPMAVLYLSRLYVEVFDTDLMLHLWTLMKHNTAFFFLKCIWGISLQNTLIIESLVFLINLFHTLKSFISWSLQITFDCITANSWPRYIIFAKENLNWPISIQPFISALHMANFRFVIDKKDSCNFCRLKVFLRPLYCEKSTSTINIFERKFEWATALCNIICYFLG